MNELKVGDITTENGVDWTVTTVFKNEAGEVFAVEKIGVATETAEK
jgi:hypothetical protein